MAHYRNAVQPGEGYPARGRRRHRNRPLHPRLPKRTQGPRKAHRRRPHRHVQSRRRRLRIQGYLRRRESEGGQTHYSEMTAADDKRVKSAKAMAHLFGVLTRFEGRIYVVTPTSDSLKVLLTSWASFLRSG